jgi:hypothetical protein
LRAKRHSQRQNPASLTGNAAVTLQANRTTKGLAIVAYRMRIRLLET